MSAQHTPGRLTVRGGYSIYADDGKTPVADTCLTNSVPDNDEANARRLVACWNACEGIDTDDLEAHSVNIIHKLHNDAAKRVLSERDELLAALKELAHTLDSEHLLHDDQRAAFAQARAAIAKAGGAV